MVGMGLSVALLGYGAIGREVRRMLAAGDADIDLIGVLTRASAAGLDRPAHTADGLAVLDLDSAINRADVIIECASAQALRQHGERIIGAGTDLLIVSLGALADPALRETLLRRGPGRAHPSTGAIGGLDLLCAAAVDGGLERVTLCTTKSPASLIHPAMDPATRLLIETATGPTEVFSGSVAEAVRHYPKNINVAAALALAVGDFDKVSVRIVADPQAVLTRHVIQAQGPAGEYSFDISNAPDPGNPATSALTARAVVAGIRRLAGTGACFI